MVENIYNDMLCAFPDTLEETSKDSSGNDRMTACQNVVVNVDKLKDDLAKTMRLTEFPRSCDALYMASQEDFFMIEFKNGAIRAKENYEIKVKIWETLLMLSEKFNKTIKYMRENMNLILVYNESATHGTEQFNDTGMTKIRRLEKSLYNRTAEHTIRFGLSRFKKLYFKNVFTYTEKEFETEFVSKHCETT